MVEKIIKEVETNEENQNTNQQKNNPATPDSQVQNTDKSDPAVKPDSAGKEEPVVNVKPDGDIEPAVKTKPAGRPKSAGRPRRAVRKNSASLTTPVSDTEPAGKTNLERRPLRPAGEPKPASLGAPVSDTAPAGNTNLERRPPRSSSRPKPAVRTKPDSQVNPDSDTTPAAGNTNLERRPPRSTGRPKSAVRTNPANQAKPESETAPAGKANPARKTNPAGRHRPNRRTNPAGQVKSAGETEPVVKVNPVGRTNPASKTNPSGRTNPIGRANPAGKTNQGDRPNPAVRHTSSRNVDVRLDTSVIVSVQNIGSEVKTICDSLISGLGRGRRNFEIIFVDDSSSDETWEQLKHIVKKDSRVKLIRMRSSFGEAASFDAGFKMAKGAKIAFFSSRVRINHERVPALLRKLDDGYDLVMGRREPRKDSIINRFVSNVFNLVIRMISKTKLRDNNSGVFAVRRNTLNEMPMYGDFNLFLPVLAQRKGYKVTDEAIEQLPGRFRKSLSFGEYVQRSLDIITVFFLSNYSKKPLHFLGFFGLSFTLAGAGISIYLFIQRIMLLGPIAGRPLLLLGVLLLVIGIQMISIGLIGEMIIFTHAREIKEYSIEEQLG